ncbi:MAG TPA: hypothetical protein VGB65_13660 [Allosphingosinicella sp.]|jgi:uncharacterized protein YlxW (UPF0749 family)
MSGGQVMLVLIVAMVMIASIIRGKQASHGRGADGLDGPGDSAENVRLRDEVADLKKRLAVLERITVEKENSLERQIEALRDK